MTQKHPHSEATYRVLALKDGGFGVEVTIPDSAPTIVTSFAAPATAEAWIEAHRQRVQAKPTLDRRWPRRQRSG